MTLSAEEKTRTPNKSCFYMAEATIEGQRYTARSRHGACHALARVLVATGIPDQPVEVRQDGLRGCMTFRSLHKMALWTIEENASTPVRRRGWIDPVGALRRLEVLPKTGSKPDDAGEDAPETFPLHETPVLNPLSP